MENTHLISPQPLTFEVIYQILDKNKKLELSDESAGLITHCKNWLDHKLQTEDGPVYGINTGFGALHNRSISKSDLSKLQENLLLSHACGAGPEVPRDVVRLMLLLKIHALSLGKSGVQMQTVRRLIDFFNKGIVPVVLEQGSLGASGDLAPLAHLFLPLLGHGEVWIGEEKMEASEMLQRHNWQPVRLEAKEGLALLNGTQFMSAHAVYTLLRAFRVEQQADMIAALSLDAFNGRIDPFMEMLHTVRPHPGQIETARHIRELLEGSELINQQNKEVQDPYSFRCIPQVHGAVKDAIGYVARVVETEINSVTDNPIVFPDEEQILSGGNFHGEPLALALDFLGIAISELASISERRVYRLISGERGLPVFLVANPGLNSGFMIPQYAAASIVSLNKQMATPASVDSIPSSNEQEDHVSMGGNAATKTLKIVRNVERVLGIELFNAAQALEFRRPSKTSAFLENLMKEFRAQVPFVHEDKIMYMEIEKTVNFLRDKPTERFRS
ncbi:histidine ammonia-lyase [Marinilabilia salmonicolor]|jgi:histidine ammonia-lyase|uniref:histidine ammonia-lyase n=1 Tax=Marinilabilia salmonicolor TaxID=989 RepID=UPI000D07CE57|nr:histidine ammonia-lyase [Marinilabilia salmonicolor]PRZ02287.1 histidine ammonia-lyase [Marinilabilia salmonicolor]